ncbi:extracellular solute-binding protein [Phytohabitans sp. ZYX-F-186]|uniref:Extracellular solute-binding protein n=1 Tax=Phytohabitans maris TaxID=3071409 RepID=A0ABU0ZC08_9ACTN|nr:extracellular solute-binding protein [Phytohabitans sp. ZYX-F-186]MDQ7904605.1 extracellular solute-binding protein [Phytohabitans sp. ZYX-F-186]
MTPPLAGAATNRRKFLGLTGLSAAAVAGGGLLSACGEGGGSKGAADDTSKVSGVLPAQGKLPDGIPQPDITSTRPIPDGYNKYPSNLVDLIADKPGSSGKEITAMTPAWGPAPPGLGQNAYLAAVNDELGIPVNFSIQDGLTYADKLNAMLGARDVPDLLCVPQWEVEKLPRFADAVKVLFEDLTDFLSGDKVNAYPMLATFPTGAWQNALWNQRLMAVPNPTDGPFPWALFYRKDLLDAKGLTYPKSIDELISIGKQVTDTKAGVWAFSDIFAMVQMFHKSPASETGWRLKADGTPEHKYETPEFKAALEVMARIYKDGLVHPDLAASKGGDMKKLMESGRILFMQDGIGGWQGMQAQQQKVTPGFNLQPVPIFSATGGDPLVWGDDKPISYTFVKKGLGKERVEELLRVVNWCSAPFGSKEWHTREYGVEGKHHTMTPDGPVKTDLGFKEIANQYFFVSGRSPVVQPWPETPKYVPDLLSYSNAMVKFMETNPWDGIKLEFPATYKSQTVPYEDKITDIVRGRRPLTEFDGLVNEWKTAGGGNEARDFLAKARSDAGK